MIEHRAPAHTLFCVKHRLPPRCPPGTARLRRSAAASGNGHSPGRLDERTRGRAGQADAAPCHRWRDAAQSTASPAVRRPMARDGWAAPMRRGAGTGRHRPERPGPAGKTSAPDGRSPLVPGRGYIISALPGSQDHAAKGGRSRRAAISHTPSCGEGVRSPIPLGRPGFLRAGTGLPVARDHEKGRDRLAAPLVRQRRNSALSRRGGCARRSGTPGRSDRTALGWCPDYRSA